MRISIPTESVRLTDILTDIQLNELEQWKEEKQFTLTIQNLWNVNIYIENWHDASIEDSIQIPPSYEAEEIVYFNIKRFYVISEWSENNNIRIITT